MNYLSIDNIPEKDRKRIKRTSRSTCIGENMVIVNTISGIELFSTKTIHIEIIETKQLPFYVITAFPNCPTLNDLSDDKLIFVI